MAKARAAGVTPDGPAGAELVSALVGDADPREVLTSLEAGLDAGAERYRRLVGRVRGQDSAPDATEDLRWLATALRLLAEARFRTSRAAGT
ncbi:hypothetical protein [Lentzea sp. NPDC060358]|uniref:hypothetical protein n=1 Tax=Lentzea sp. NPDC060358 TaxID=3347103 RepID=UPI00364D3604